MEIYTQEKTNTKPNTVNLHPRWVEKIDSLVVKGLYTSRGEFMREAIRNKLKEEYGINFLPE